MRVFCPLKTYRCSITVLTHFFALLLSSLSSFLFLSSFMSVCFLSVSCFWFIYSIYMHGERIHLFLRKPKKNEAVKAWFLKMFWKIPFPQETKNLVSFFMVISVSLHPKYLKVIIAQKQSMISTLQAIKPELLISCIPSRSYWDLPKSCIIPFRSIWLLDSSHVHHWSSLLLTG